MRLDKLKWFRALECTQIVLPLNVTARSQAPHVAPMFFHSLSKWLVPTFSNTRQEQPISFHSIPSLVNPENSCTSAVRK